MKTKWKLNLQRFAEPVPVNDDDLPVPPVTPKSDKILPSDIAPEAWKNVETLLVTLSSNIRVQIEGIVSRIEKLEGLTGETLATVTAGVADLQSTMAEFRQLLADATVEVPEPEVKENEERKEEQKKNKSGYLDRR